MWKLEPATCRKVGAYARVWVADAVWHEGYITPEVVNPLADKFDLLYPIETNLYGYEMRYGSAEAAVKAAQENRWVDITPDMDEWKTMRGIDDDDKIQIFLYEMPLDIGGFFWGKDEYRDAAMTSRGLRSNEAEIFYLNASLFKGDPLFMYSTLAHEFQHMIHLNQKTLRYNLASETWYNEMLSMLTEDMLAPLVGVDWNMKGHPISDRIRDFNGSYWMTSTTQWNIDDYPLDYPEADFYAAAYAFGAFLARNFGGVNFIREVYQNRFVNRESLSAALQAIHAPNGVWSFDEALARFPEVLQNKEASTLVSWTVQGVSVPVLGAGAYASFNNDVPGENLTPDSFLLPLPDPLPADTPALTNVYGFHRFNPYSKANPNLCIPQERWNALKIPADYSAYAEKGGPYFWDMTASQDRPPASIDVQKILTADGNTGTCSLTLSYYTGSVQISLYTVKDDGTFEKWR